MSDMMVFLKAPGIMCVRPAAYVVVSTVGATVTSGWMEPVVGGDC